MAYAMMKIVAFLCMSLLIAHVDSARMLKQAGIMTAETHSTEETLPPPVDEASQYEAIPAPDSAEEYNYNQGATTDNTAEFANEGFLIESPPSSDTTTDNTAEFAGEGFLVESPPSSDTTTETATDAFPTEISFAQDQGTGSEEGTLDGPGATTESFAQDEFLGDDTQFTDESGESKPYEYDATTQDADPVLPGQDGTSDATLADNQDLYSFSDAVVQSDTTEPGGFEFDESKPEEFGN